MMIVTHYYANELCLGLTKSLLGNNSTPIQLKINQPKAISVVMWWRIADQTLQMTGESQRDQHGAPC